VYLQQLQQSDQFVARLSQMLGVICLICFSFVACIVCKSVSPNYSIKRPAAKSRLNPNWSQICVHFERRFEVDLYLFFFFGGGVLMERFDSVQFWR